MQIDDELREIFSDPANNFARRRAWVIYHIKLKGLTLAEIARRNGVGRQCAQRALSQPYPKYERLIAQALGLKVQSLFPDRYDRDGTPRKYGQKRPRACDSETSKNSTPRNRRNIESGAENRHRRVV